MVPLHYKIAEKVMELMKEGVYRKVIHERLSGNIIEQEASSNTSFQMTGEIFISSADIYKGLKIDAIKLVIRIQQELEMNNPLWECTDKDRRQTRSAIAQLKRANILEAIPGTDVYLVNPSKIRKGRPLAIYGAIYEYAKKMWEKDKNWRPTTEDIRRLKSPEKVLLISDIEKDLNV